MFVNTLKLAGATVLCLSLSAASAMAADKAGWQEQGGTIPVTVNLTGVQIADGPIYISVQQQAHYMGMKGHGAILKTVTPGNMTATVKVSEPGDYAVSIWHDMNDDGVFSMDDNHRILDGYGSSGMPPSDNRPTFDDVKIKVESFGTQVSIPVKYPS